jgi:hypothetical protein
MRSVTLTATGTECHESRMWAKAGNTRANVSHQIEGMIGFVPERNHPPRVVPLSTIFKVTTGFGRVDPVRILIDGILPGTIVQINVPLCRAMCASRADPETSTPGRSQRNG